MEIFHISVGLLGANCYIIHKNNKGIIVDPGGDMFRIEKELNEKNIEPCAVLLTHGHADHIAAVEEIKNKYNIDVYIHELDEELLKDPKKNLSSMLTMPDIITNADKIFNENKLSIEEIDIEIIHTPGHTQGSVCFLVGKYLLSGDTVCKGSIGRTDLIGGNYDDIIKSLEKIKKLSDDILILPGHGPATKLIEEKQTNYYFNRN